MTDTIDIAPVDLSDSRSYVPGVPHEYLTYLRRHDPVHWQAEANGPGFWAVTKSASPFSQTVSMIRSAVRWMLSSRSRTIRGVNPLLTSRR